MLIYIEGIDKCGKSTFAKQLSFELKVPLYRKLPPVDLTLSEHHSYFKGVGFALMELHNIFQFNAIIDRSFISDWVYSNRNQDVYSHKIWQEWEGRHQHADSIFVVHIEAPPDVIEKRLYEEPDKFMGHNDIARFLFLYDNYMGQTKFHVIHVNGTAPDSVRAAEIENVRQTVTKYINH